MINMKRILFICSLLICSSITKAETSALETFDANLYGWLEFVKNDGSAIIKDGVMKLEGKVDLSSFFTPSSNIITSCYAPINPRENFIYKCDAIAKRINDAGYFGLIFDYMDDYNYSVFFIGKGDKNAEVIYNRVVDGELVGMRSADLKLKQKRKAEFHFEIRALHDKVVFNCNEMQVMEIRYCPIRCSGIGFCVRGKQSVDFDNVVFIQ